MNNKINKKLTFLLLIKERREFTLRFFSYLKKVKFPFKIFIADGSKKNISNKHLDFLKLSKINFTYKKFPFDKNYNIFQKKIVDSLKLIKSEYVMLFSDDDFPIIYSINKLLLFLEKQKSYIACGGFAFNFDILNKAIIKNKLYGHPINFRKMMTANSNNKNSKKDRIIEYLNVMENSWHYVFRTKILIKNYQITQRRKLIFSNIDFYDYHQDLINFNSGKIKKIIIPTLLHQFHNKSAISERSGHEKLITNEFYKSDVSKLIHEVKNLLKIDIKKIHKIFNQSKIFDKKKNSSKHQNYSLKNHIYKKISNFKPLRIFYIFLINLFMNYKNKHIKKIITLIKNKNIKNELYLIFNFLKKNNG